MNISNRSFLFAIGVFLLSIGILFCAAPGILLLSMKDTEATLIESNGKSLGDFNWQIEYTMNGKTHTGTYNFPVMSFHSPGDTVTIRCSSIAPNIIQSSSALEFMLPFVVAAFPFVTVGTIFVIVFRKRKPKNTTTAH